MASICRELYVATDGASVAPTRRVDVLVCRPDRPDIRTAAKTLGQETRCLAYLLGPSVRSDGDASRPCSSGVAYADAERNGWLLHDLSGAPLTVRGYPEEHLLDLSNPACRRAWVAGVLQVVPGWHGVFVDNCLMDLRWALGWGDAHPPSSVSAWLTDERWAVAVRSLLAEAQAALQGRRLVANAAPVMGAAGAWRAALLPLVQGVMDEAWLRPGPGVALPPDTGPAGTFAWSWRASFAAGRMASRGGVDWLVRWGGGTPAETLFAVASYALVAEPGYAALTVQARYGSGQPADALAPLRPLGAPKAGPVRSSDGSWSRVFAAGRVVVNPTWTAAGGLAPMTATIEVTA